MSTTTYWHVHGKSADATLQIPVNGVNCSRHWKYARPFCVNSKRKAFEVRPACSLQVAQVAQVAHFSLPDESAKKYLSGCSCQLFFWARLPRAENPPLAPLRHLWRESGKLVTHQQGGCI